jgi:NADH-quinone oxidoreductase subunit M
LVTGGLFLVAGILEDKLGTLKIRRLGGLWDTMPVLSRIFLILTLASIALPLTSSFVGEFLILVGGFQTHPAAAAVATSGVVLSAIYMLWMFQRVVYGSDQRVDRIGMLDISGTSRTVLSLLVVLILTLGVFPKRCLEYINPALPISLSGEQTKP